VQHGQGEIRAGNIVAAIEAPWAASGAEIKGQLADRLQVYLLPRLDRPA